MAKSEHLEIVARGPAEIAQWRDMHPGAALDLSGANLSGARLESADLSDADLSGACLDGADLRGARLTGASLRQASLGGADLSDADVNNADLSAAALVSADLSRADLAGADLSDADLSGAFVIDAELTRARLIRANLSSAHLTRARLIEADLTDALVENSVVSGTVVERLRGCPQPPEVLWFDDEPRTLVTETGVLLVLNDPDTPISPDRARRFFVEPQVVELVWDRSFSDAALLAYAAYQAVARAAGTWPDEIRFLAGVIRLGRMVFLFEAPPGADVVGALPILLEPFGQAEFVDFPKTAKAWSGATGEATQVTRQEIGGDLRQVADRLHSFEGFADNIPVELRAAGQRVPIEFRARPVDGPTTLGSSVSTGTIEFDAASAQPPDSGAGLLLSVLLADMQPDTAAVRFVHQKPGSRQT